MTVPLEIETEIRRLHFAEHWPVGTVASQLAIHEDVVRRVLGLDTRPRTLLTPRPRLADPYRDFLVEQMTRYPRLRTTRLYDSLRGGLPAS